MKQALTGRLKRLAWLPLPLLGGCQLTLFDSKGQIGLDERDLILTAVGLMLLVVVPVIVLTLAFAWKYRASNREATYSPERCHSRPIEAVVWAVPCLIIAILATITWYSTHELDPYRPLDSEVRPVTIQAVSLDWKWLFIYPDLGIATVNEIAFPANTPVNFEITSGSVMNSFYIPQLGGQVYSMAGMRTELHLIANEQGVFDGISANYSGAGFSGMKFKAIATSGQGFDDWVAKVRAAPAALQWADYTGLAKPTSYVPPSYYGRVAPRLFGQILNQFSHPRPTLAGAAAQPSAHGQMDMTSHTQE